MITCIAFPLSILLLVLGRYAAKWENPPCMAVFMLGLLAGCAYFIFKLVRIWQQSTTTYVSLTKSLTVFDALSIVSLLACFILGGVVRGHFGRGLKEAMGSRSKVVEEEEYDLSTSKSKESAGQKRISIS